MVGRVARGLYRGIGVIVDEDGGEGDGLEINEGKE